MMGQASCATYSLYKPSVSPCLVVASPYIGCVCAKQDGSDTYFLAPEKCDGYVALSPGESREVDTYILQLEKSLQESNKRKLFP